MASLVSSAIPKSRSGRKAAEADPELKAALLKALQDNPRTKVEGEDRPAGHGPDTEYDTEGKAESAGRRYSKAIAEELGKTVRVSVYAKNDDKKAPYCWRIYIPLSQTDEKKGK